MHDLSGYILTALGMLGALLVFALTITLRTGRILERIDTHAETSKALANRIDKHRDDIADHDARLRVLEAEPTEKLRAVR